MFKKKKKTIYNSLKFELSEIYIFRSIYNFKIYFKNITSGPGGLRRYMKKLCSKKEHASGQKNNL